jgi:hypothetical protein
MLHSPPQWRGWVSSRELAEQRRGVIPRRVMARLCCVRALNAHTRVREQVRVQGSLERGGARSRGCEPSSEAEPARGRCQPSSEAEPAQGGASPRARRNLLEGGVCPRARQNLLEGAFDGATPVVRGDHRSVGRALCACLVKWCVLLSFFAGFRQDPPGF